MEGRFRFLGTGSSLGVPVIGCSCSVCRSGNAKNVRSRSASLIRVLEKTFLLDAGPDYRTQALTHDINKIDGFILTHAHYDHMAGMDDLKIYAHVHGKIPCLSFESTFQEVRGRYGYLFKQNSAMIQDSPFFAWQRLTESFGKVVFETVPLTYVTFFQSGMQVMGIKIGDLAYISDIKEYDPQLISYLQGTKTLIVSALRQTSSPAHFSLEQACKFADLVKPKTTYLTHVAHEMDYEQVQQTLPDGVFLSYDGLEISFQME